MFCLSNFCCVCLKTDLDYRDISSLDSDDISLKHKLNYCVFKQDYLTDEIPLKMCVKCYIELRIAYKFRKTCLRNNECIKEYLFELKHAFNSSENCTYSQLYVNLFDNIDTNDDKNQSDSNQLEQLLDVKAEFLAKNNLILLEDSFSVEETNLDSYNNEEYIKLKKEIYNDIFNEDLIVVSSSDEEKPFSENKNDILSQTNLIPIDDSCNSSTATINLEKNDCTNSSDNIPLSKLVKVEVDKTISYLSDDVETVILQNNQLELDVGNNLLQPIDNSYLSDISSDCSFFDRDDSKQEMENTSASTNTFEKCLQLKNSAETDLRNDDTAQKQIENDTIPQQVDVYGEKLRCYICNVDFSNKNLLNWHLNIHKDFTSAFIENINQKIEHDKYKCTICKADFSKGILLKWHMKIHEFVLSEHAFKCHLCPERFKIKMQLTRHLKNKHEFVSDNKCNICNKHFATRKCLLAHRKVHKDQKTTNKWFRCNFCSSGFLEKEDLIKHRRIHIENKKFGCNICNKKFLYKSSLLRHLTSHNVIREKTFHCTYCPKRFEHRNTLSTHIKFHEDTGKIFYCTFCTKYFADKESLNDHVAKHSKNYRYKCEICGKSMVHARSLKLHLLLHRSERKFKCNICQKGFKLRMYLTQHMKLHADRKRYECKDCGVKISRRNLKRHAFLHTKLRPFQCKICGKSYGRKDILTVHMKAKHPSDE